MSNIINPIINNIEKFGKSNGENNSTAPDRPFTSEIEKVITVGSGKDYATIQEAINQVPYMLRHFYEIKIDSGTYTEDIYVPPCVVSRLHSTEGAIIGLKIRGMGSNITDTQIDSITVSGCVGSHCIELSNFETTKKVPTSDEDTSIAIYGSNSILIHNCKVSGSVAHSIMAYNSNVYTHGIEFANSVYSVLSKNMSTIIFGDTSVPNTGSVSGALIKCGKGSFVHLHNSEVVTPKINSEDSTGKIWKYQDTITHNLGSPSDDNNYVILLEKYNGGVGNYTQGKFFCKRGSSSNNIIDIVEINTGSTNTSSHCGFINVLRTFDAPGDFDLFTCDYNSETYLALKYNGNWNDRAHTDSIEFIGVNSSNNIEKLKIVPYYTPATSTVLNSEINSSLVSFVSSQSGLINFGNEIKSKGKPIPTIESGTSAPSSTPSKVGDMYIDTTGIKVYVATGTASSADWSVLN